MHDFLYQEPTHSMLHWEVGQPPRFRRPWVLLTFAVENLSQSPEQEQGAVPPPNTTEVHLRRQLLL